DSECRPITFLTRSTACSRVSKGGQVSFRSSSALVGGFGSMTNRSEYRGYRIEMKTIDDHWMVSVFPTRANLPWLRSVPFHQFPRPQTEVLAEAKRRIDRVLSD